jgi:hypothetical protein
MPYQEIVDAATLDLLKSLQTKEYLKGFYLVGGSALALHLGHRKSVDIDLFSNVSFDTSALLESLLQDYPYQLTLTAGNTLKGSIKDIKVDFLAHRYSLILEPVSFSGIQMLSMPDIAAMKLNAISTSGQRSKDFIDIYYLLDHFDIAEILTFYKTKYLQENDTFVLKSLIYFDDVDLSDWPVLVKDPDLKWNTVKKRLEKAVLDYVKKE